MHFRVESSPRVAAGLGGHWGSVIMFHVTRRQALAASGGLLGTLLAPSRFASGAVGSTLNIA